MSKANSAALLSQQEFDPWGKVRSGSVISTTVHYTGQRLDGSGLLYYHARMYNPVIGRFISADSEIPDPSNPQQLNRYTYVINNPLRYTDPNGHAHCDGVACQREGGGGGGGGGAIPAPNLKQLAVALAIAATAVIAYVTGQGNNKQATPAQSDTGGQAASQGGMDPDDPDNLDYLVANKNAVKVSRDTTNSAQGEGARFEEFLKQQLNGEGAFKAQSNRTGMIRQYDGAYNNGQTWYEAKAWNWSKVNLSDLKADFGTRINIAKEAGREFQLISRYAIPEEFKQWLLSKGASFREIPMP